MFSNKNKFTAIKHEKNYKGFVLKRFLKEFIWNFYIEQKYCTLRLVVSKFTGNYKVVLNKVPIYRNSVYLNKDIDLQFKIKNIQFDLFLRKKRYCLIIDGSLFEKHIQNQELSKSKLQHNDKSYRSSSNQTVEFIKKPTLIRSSSLDQKFFKNIASNSLFKDIGSQQLINNQMEESQFSQVDSDINSQSNMQIEPGLIVSSRKIIKDENTRQLNTQMFEDFENSEINYATIDFKSKKDLIGQMQKLYNFDKYKQLIQRYQ